MSDPTFTEDHTAIVPASDQGSDYADPGYSDGGTHDDSSYDSGGQGSGGYQVVDSNDNGVDDTIVVELAPGVQGAIVDVNEDGTPDVVMIDLDGNGKIDTMVKADGKGDFVIGYDDDEDGQVDRQEPITREQLDSAVPGLADVLDPASGGGGNHTVSDGVVGSPSDPQELDTNENGVTDAVSFQIAPGIEAVAVDQNEDGTFDAVLIDMSGDGTLDTMVAPDGHGGFVIGYDDDGDGRIDRQETATRAQLDQAVPGLADALDPRGGSGSGGSGSGSGGVNV